MKVLLMMDPLIPVPPVHYGGIERVVFDLAEGLSERGHSVAVWAGPGSVAPGELKTFGKTGETGRWSALRNTALITSWLVRRGNEFDIIHNFGRLALSVGALVLNKQTIQTYMRRISPRSIRMARKLGGRSIHFTAVSEAIRDTGSPGGGEWSVIYNCAPTKLYKLSKQTNAESAPLLFLGRLERCKGVHTAIEVARRTGRKLIVAGNISNLPEERRYFESEIRPHCDGQQVVFVGPVDNRQKNELIGSSAAMLLPIEWEEPFPVVLPEALLCGTPVLAFRRGGVPEGITDGVTGYVCDTSTEMADCVARLRNIDRVRCRAEGERRFGTEAVVREYECLYRRLLKS